VITGFAWGIVAATGEHRALPSVSTRPIVFLLLSGITTGESYRDHRRAVNVSQATAACS